jgi:hypothetical protein
MNSPPASPPRFELGGASRVTGGILRGRAYGNVFNHADAEMEFDMEPRMGRVHIYTARVDPSLAKPDMVLKHNVTPKLKPILKALARGYSPVRSKLFFIIWFILLIFLVDDNRRVFVYEDDMWTVKGRYEHAIENDDDVSWTYENGHDVLRFLLVSFPWYVCLKFSSDVMYRWMMSVVVNHLSPSLPYPQPRGFLLGCLLLLLGLTFLSPLLIPPLLVRILLRQGFYRSLEFLLIWLIVTSVAFT